jgi:hypothetical protein
MLRLLAKITVVALVCAPCAARAQAAQPPVPVPAKALDALNASKPKAKSPLVQQILGARAPASRSSVNRGPTLGKKQLVRATVRDLPKAR